MPLNDRDRGSTPVTRAQATADVLALLSSLGPERVGAFRILQRGSLSLFHAHLLMRLAIGGPLSMGQIAELLDVSVASATGIVDRLEKRAMVRRRRDESDRRVVLVEPTDSARELLAEMDRERRARLEEVLAELDDTELVALRSALGAMKRARERHHGEHAVSGTEPARRARERDA